VTSEFANPALAAIASYREALAKALPGKYTGLYLTGSVALGDWIPERSDLDILVVTNGQLAATDVDRLADLHARLAGRPYLDAIYLSRADLGAELPADHGGLPHAIDGVLRRDGYRPDPVLWATLDRHGVTLEGPLASTLAVAPEPARLRDWNLGNLHSYWRPWAADARLRLADRDSAVPLAAEVVVHALLGPGRLHYTISTGEILAKSASAGYTAGLLPGHADLLARGQRWRLGEDAEQFFRADGLAACDLVDAVADAAFALGGPS
jgi:predicted nucleotidyltransferase